MIYQLDRDSKQYDVYISVWTSRCFQWPHRGREIKAAKEIDLREKKNYLIKRIMDEIDGQMLHKF